MKNIVLIAFLIATSGLFAQVSVNGGGSMLLGFGAGKPWGGMHIGIEIPRDDAVSFFGRYTYHFKNTERDSSTYELEVTDPEYGYVSFENTQGKTSMNYHILEGGTRYYIGNGFDYGWGAYGGSSIMIIFNTIKVGFASPYESNTFRDGSVFSVGLGLGGGIKYSMATVGTIYLDASLNYKILNQASQPYVSDNLFTNLIFNFNLGIRRDIIW